MNETKPAVLIVDDSPELFEEVGKLLVSNDFRVDFAHNGSDALRKIHRENYDVVLCDIDMPGMSGLELLESLRKAEHGQDVVLMTDYLDPEYFIKAIRLGAADFLSKPVEFQQLISALTGVLRKQEDKKGTDTPLNRMPQIALDLVIDPRKFSQHGINSICQVFLKRTLRLPQNLINEILICVDEMVYNAYIHGTLGLSVQQRLLNHPQMQEIIQAKLAEPAINSKRIRFNMTLNHEGKYLQLTVEDDGEGFDYLHWQQNLNQEENILSLDEHGRGLAVLSHLSDSICFSNGGRKVQIVRNLNPEHTFWT